MEWYETKRLCLIVQGSATKSYVALLWNSDHQLQLFLQNINKEIYEYH